MEHKRNWLVIIATVLIGLMLVPPADAGRRKKKKELERRMQEIDWEVGRRIDSAIREARDDRNTRSALLGLINYRSSLDSTERARFDSMARRKGVRYLESIYFTKREVVLTHEDYVDSDSMGILGSSHEYAHYGSVAKKGEILYRLFPSGFRGLYTHTDIRRDPQVGGDLLRRFKGKEVYGSHHDFAVEKDLSFSEIFTQEPSSGLPGRYGPLTYIKSTSEVSGGILGGVSDFVERNPVLATIAVFAVGSMLSDDSESGSSSSGSSAGDYDETTRLYVAWQEAEKRKSRAYESLMRCVRRCQSERSAFTNCYDHVCSSQNESYKTAKRNWETAKRRYADHLN